MDDILTKRVLIPGSDLEEIFATASGPGGQHANRTQSAVRLRLNVASSTLDQKVKLILIEKLGEVIEVQAADSRSQFRNRAIARQRLAETIDLALTPSRPRRVTRPTVASKKRRRKAKQMQSEKKRMRRRPADDS